MNSLVSQWTLWEYGDEGFTHGAESIPQWFTYKSTRKVNLSKLHVFIHLDYYDLQTGWSPKQSQPNQIIFTLDLWSCNADDKSTFLTKNSENYHTVLACSRANRVPSAGRMKPLYNAVSLASGYWGPVFAARLYPATISTTHWRESLQSPVLTQH